MRDEFAAEGGQQASPNNQHASTSERLSIRTAAARSPSASPPLQPPLVSAASVDLDWANAGPFRAAPVGYIMRSTPTGTPLASPREGAPAGADLEAPLLPGRRKPGGGVHDAAFEDCGWIKSICFGLINTAAGVPALVAFCAVVFKDPIYRPWIDPLCRFFYLSSAVHQAVVCVLSAVPNAIGQVQDVGLIFLSAMASSIAASCTSAGLDAAAALGTTLLTMAVSTVLVGAGLVLVARLRLAVAVQHVPLPAVGGYLSYVGYFCIASGLGLGCGVELGSLASWAQLADAQTLLRVLPTLGSTALMMLTMARCKHPLALPAVLAAIVLAFHAALWGLGVSLEQAQDAGWVLKPAASTGNPLHLWRMFDWPLSNLHLQAALAQVGKLAGLFLLVCFGSCMDIAAIQQDTPFRLDFNRELTAIGISNMATGAIGAGVTGSFIFSQTIFTGRAGVRSRLNGAVVAAAELAIFALPFSIVQYGPTFFFGSLLLWFGVEICLDWIVHSYAKLTRTEYCLLLATFGAIMQWGLEAGIAAGVVLSTLYFAAAYAQSQLSAFALVPGRSGIVRAADQEAALELLRPAHLVSAQLRGFLFFGVAATLSRRLHEAAQSLESGWGAGGGGGSSSSGSPSAADELYPAGSTKHAGALQASMAAPRFLLLDFSGVKGMDATAARTLASLFVDVSRLDITPVVTGASAASIRQLLLAHGAPLPPAPAACADEAAAAAAAAAADEEPGMRHCFEFASREEGLRFCEQQLLAEAVRCGLCRAPSEPVSLEQLLRSHASQAGLPFASKEASGAVAAAILPYCQQLRFGPGERLWSEGQPADAVYIVEQGRLTVRQHVQAPGGSSSSLPDAAADGQQQQEQQQHQRQQQHRVFEFGSGCVAGAVDFYLHRTRSSSAAVAGSSGAGASSGGSCRVLRLSREALGRMAVEEPAALHFLQAVVLRAKCLDLGAAAELAVAGRQ